MLSLQSSDGAVCSHIVQVAVSGCKRGVFEKI